MNTIRLFADASGVSHFEGVSIALEPVDFAPPAPPLDLSAYQAAERYTFFRFPADWYGDWHRAPWRQVFFLLSGELAVEVSDGEVRHLKPGCVVFVEDPVGTGHVSWVVGAEDVLSAIVQLAVQARARSTRRRS